MGLPVPHLSTPYSKRYILTFDCEVIYPEIPISLQTKYGVIEEMFFVDTGADITTLPNYARYLFEETPTEGDHEMYGRRQFKILEIGDTTKTCWGMDTSPMYFCGTR